MSYCVNCGVELEETENKCVLCGCEVTNPMKPIDKNKLRPYPDKVDEIAKKANQRFAAMILSLLFVLPAAICFFLNILYYNDIFWSAYVIGGFAFLWTCIVIPLINKKVNTMVFIFFDFIAALLYLFIIDRMLSTKSFFLGLGLPILILVWVFMELLVFLYQKGKIAGFQIPALGLVFIGLFCVGVDFILNMYLKENTIVSWSVFVLISASIVATMFFIIEKKHTIKEELLKRFHF